MDGWMGKYVDECQLNSVSAMPMMIRDWMIGSIWYLYRSICAKVCMLSYVKLLYVINVIAIW